jgi:hypothetical protein
MPARVGLWKMKCGENEGGEEFVAITIRKGWFIVHSEHLCETPLKAFHDGLTAIRWLFIA